MTSVSKLERSDSQGKLFIVSGPSGVGKGTLVSAAVEELPNIALCVSATTRAPRPGDIDGVMYHFVDEEKFEELASTGGLLEWAEVHGKRYGTLTEEVLAALAQGKDLILEIDTQGNDQVKSRIPSAYSIFVSPPSLDELRRRLEHRATEDAESIEKRLRTAEIELGTMDRYDYVLVNDNLDQAKREFIELLKNQGNN